jgi:hypothetical protein
MVQSAVVKPMKNGRTKSGLSIMGGMSHKDHAVRFIRRDVDGGVIRLRMALLGFLTVTSLQF